LPPKALTRLDYTCFFFGCGCQ